MVALSGYGRRAPALTDLWYAAEMPETCVALDVLLEDRPLLRRLCGASGLARALALFWFGRQFPVTFTKFHPLTGMVLPLLEAAAGRRRLVFLEFITPLDRATRLGRLGRAVTALYRIYLRLVVAPVLQRSLKSAQVMTAWEGELYAEVYGIPGDRFRFIPWSLNQGEWAPRDVKRDPGPPMVLSSGRAACDWETLFAAARGADWPLTVICGADDRARVDRLNADGRATVLSEVSLAEHAEHVARATVYVLCLHEIAASSGQIRLGNCNEIGTPVVASRVKGLEPYLIDRVNAVTVAPGDPDALRQAVDRLVASPETRRDLARRAREHSLTFTRADQFRMIEALATEPGQE